MLGLVLYEHPKEPSIRELREEIGEEATAALADLEDAGLVIRDGERIRPSREALSFDRLEMP